MTSDLMLAIKTIIIVFVSPNWQKVLKLFRQTEVCCAIGASGDRQRVSSVTGMLAQADNAPSVERQL